MIVFCIALAQRKLRKRGHTKAGHKMIANNPAIEAVPII